MKSSCLAGGHTLLYLNKSFLFLLDLLVDQQQCIVVIASKTTKNEVLLSKQNENFFSYLASSCDKRSLTC